MEPSSIGGLREPAARHSELRLRLVSGLVLALVALGATWIGGALFALLWLAASVAVAYEWNATTRAEPLWPLTCVAGLGLGALAIGHQVQAGWGFFLAISVVTAGLLGLLGRTQASRLWSVAGFGYAAILALVPAMVRDDPALGVPGILWMFAIVWTTDIAGYFAGRAIGGPKLWPQVSPKKTWSGFTAGLIGAVAAGLGVALLVSRHGGQASLALSSVALASAVASVASQFGDLAESALKRRFGAKDSGRLIPGHGGVMDRLDGFIAVALLFGLTLVGVRLAR